MGRLVAYLCDFLKDCELMDGNQQQMQRSETNLHVRDHLCRKEH
jgi:hypothetical protein